MKLKLNRYKNYGCMLHSENKPESLTKFYWSFYELNNNKTYSLQYIEYLKAQRWDGKMPQVVGTGSGLIIDLK